MTERGFATRARGAGQGRPDPDDSGRAETAT